MKYVFITISLIGFSIQESTAQQAAQFTQYMFNGLILNPAYAGADEALSITFLNRNQWVSIEGAPVTQTLSAHTLFAKRNVGLGLSLINDKIGVHKNQQIIGSVAYHLKVSTSGVLSFGLQGGLNILKSDYASLNMGTTIDPVLQNTSFNTTYFNVGMGLYYRSPKLHVGFSAPDLIPEKHSVNDTLAITWQKAHYFLFSKYRLALNNDLTLEPSILLKYNVGIPLSYDVNACLIIKKVLTLGLSYRRAESIDFLLKAQVTPQLQVGYSYDFVTGKVSSMSHGTNEILVNYVFKYAHSKIASPR